METKKITAIIIFVVVIIAGGFVLYLQRETILTGFSKKQPPQTQEQNQSQSQNQAATVEDKKIRDNTSPFSIDVTYPQIPGQDSFNKKVEDIVNNELTNFKEYSLENDNAVRQTDPAGYAEYPREYTFAMDYYKGTVDENVASFVLNIEEYEGGAHGAHNLLAINYDLKNNKDIQLADLFSGQPNYLQTISDYCVSDLTKQINQKVGDVSGTWISQGAGPSLENFSIFLINKDNITFYFPEYQVAPYAAGSFQVTMPR